MSKRGKKSSASAQQADHEFPPYHHKSSLDCRLFFGDRSVEIPVSYTGNGPGRAVQAEKYCVRCRFGISAAPPVLLPPAVTLRTML